MMFRILDVLPSRMEFDKAEFASKTDNKVLCQAQVRDELINKAAP
jgi:hypothetical protein